MHNEKTLKGKVAFITGGAGLLGPAHGRALAACGATIILADIREKQACQETMRIAKEYAVPARGLCCNLLEHRSIQKAITQVITEFERIDILINNAQSFLPDEKETFEEYLPEHWNRTSNINLKGMFLCTQEVVKHMLKNKGPAKGTIINIASVYGVIAPDMRIYFDGKKRLLSPSPAVYSATKGGIIAFTKYMAA